MKCNNCGSEVNSTTGFCSYCGAQLQNSYGNRQMNQPQNSYGNRQMNQPQNPYGNQQMNQPQNPYGSQQMNQPQNSYGNQQMNQPQNPYGSQPAPVYVPPYQEPGFDYTPISMWGYFGYEILFSIPCVGFILLLVFSFGGTNNINVRNFARSYFCLLIILAVLFLLFAMFAGVSVAALS